MGYRFLTKQKNCPAIWGPDLRREFLYAVSCLAFCGLGTWLITYSHEVNAWLAAAGWPYIGQRLLFVHGCADILQGILSFASDVVLVDVPSSVHLADRLLAVVLTLVGIYVEVCVLIFSSLSSLNRMLMLILLVMALWHHFRAKFAIRDRVYSQFVKSHTIWHLAITVSLPLPVHLSLFH
jgi:hypothetical protein